MHFADGTQACQYLLGSYLTYIMGAQVDHQVCNFEKNLVCTMLVSGSYYLLGLWAWFPQSNRPMAPVGKMPR